MLMKLQRWSYVISEGEARRSRPAEVEDVLNSFDPNQCNQEMGILKAVTSKDIVYEKIVNLIDHHRARVEDNTPA